MARAFLEQISEALTVEPGGKLTPEQPSGEARVRNRAGSWRLLPSSAEFTVLLREGPAGASEDIRRRVVLAGDLSVITPADLSMFLSQSRLTGVLLSRAHGIDRTLSFKNGKLCWGSSSEPSERLGEVCVRHGLVDRFALQHFMETEDPENRRLGQRFVEAKLLNGHELWKAVQLQVSEIFWALLIKNAGSFFFVDAPNDPSLDSHLALDTQGLLLEGFRRVDELRHFRRRLPSPLAMPRRLGPLPAGASAEEQRVYELVDGKRTIVDIAIASRFGEFDATKALHRLLEQGAVAVDITPPRERTPGPAELDAGLTIARHNELLRAVYEAVSESGMDAPYRISVDSYLLGEQKQMRIFSGLSLEGDGTLSEAKLISGLERATNSLGGPDAALRGLLESVLQFALFQAREILDPAIAETLNKRARPLLGK